MRNWGNAVTAAVIAGLLALTFLVGPTDAFIWTYRTTGSQTLAGIANGFLRATSWPFALAGYRFDSRDDGELLRCLHGSGIDPHALSTEDQTTTAPLLACAGRYDNSHIDLSSETQAEFPVRLGPDPYRPDTLALRFANHSSDDVILGADVLFRSAGGIEMKHVRLVALPGQYASVAAPDGIVTGGQVPDYAAVPTIARIANAAAYQPPSRP